MKPSSEPTKGGVKPGRRSVPRAKPMRVEPHRRPDDGEAFIHDPHGGPAHAPDPLAEELAEEFLESATSANEVTEEIRDSVLTEELGGPFIEARASSEFADGVDGANPIDAEREPFPTVMRAPKE
jgi:hypothetical protein